MIYQDELYHQKQLLIPFVGSAGLKKLQQSKVLVIGAGGLGSALLPHLAGAGVGTIGICEFDTVSITNLHRQHLYNFEEIGQSKLQLAIERIQKQNPKTKLISHEFSFNKQVAKEMLKDYELVIDCSDNLPTRFDIHDSCLQYQKDLLTGAVHQEEGTLNFFYFSKTKSPCLRCLWGNIDHDYVHRASAIISPLAGVIGSLMATECIKYLVKEKTLPQGETLQYDQTLYQFERLRWKSKMGCHCLD